MLIVLSIMGVGGDNVVNVEDRLFSLSTFNYLQPKTCS